MELWYYGTTMNQEAAAVLHIEKLKAIVRGGGGIWVGIQETYGLPYNLVMFNSAYSHSTLCLPDDEFFTVNAVYDVIKTSDAKFGKRGNMRKFQIYTGALPQGEPIQAEQISTEAGGVVGFYASSVDGNSRKLLGVAVLSSNQSVREVTK